MATSVYHINKGINKAIEFKGLKAQYIWYLGGGLLLLLILFAILYITGVHTAFCIGIVVIGGTILFMQVYRMSRLYGEHGLMKHLAKRSVPRVVISRSRRHFQLKGSHE